MVIEESVLINAGVNEVWETLTDLTCWKDWNRGLTDAAGETGRLASGEAFSFCIRPFLFPVRLRPVIEEVSPNERLVWKGRKFGIFSRHEFQLRQTQEGVRVTSRETLRGLPLIFGNLSFPVGKVRELTAGMLKDLKMAAEKKS
jgi:uncharacterized protein YndB with AHSA1/START domain